MLEAATTMFRQIAAGFVLLATFAFVLQGAALANGHRHPDSIKQVTAAALHAQGHEKGHTHRSDNGAKAVGSFDPVGYDHGSEQTDSCCGKFCSAATCTSVPELYPAKFRLQVSAAVHSQVPDGIGLKGLKRPMRCRRSFRHWPMLHRGWGLSVSITRAPGRSGSNGQVVVMSVACISPGMVAEAIQKNKGSQLAPSLHDVGARGWKQQALCNATDFNCNAASTNHKYEAEQRVALDADDQLGEGLWLHRLQQEPIELHVGPSLGDVRQHPFGGFHDLLGAAEA